MARTSVWYGVDSSCGLVVKPRGYLSCTHVTLTGLSRALVSLSCTHVTLTGLSRALVSLACTHVTLSANFSLSTIGLNPYYIESESQSEFAPNACCLVVFYGP